MPMNQGVAETNYAKRKYNGAVLTRITRDEVTPNGEWHVELRDVELNDVELKLTRKRSRIDKALLDEGRAYINRVASDTRLRESYNNRPKMSRGHVRNAILFGILTANERYEAAEAALALLNWWRHLPAPEDLRRVGIVYFNDKARAITEFLEAFEENPTPYHPLPGESCSAYRDRLDKMSIRGLGYVKVSFAAYLAYGGGDVICADRHILNIYTHGNYAEWMHKRSKKARAFIQEVEAYFVDLAEQYGWDSASALQWAVWCEALGIQTDHDPVSQGEKDLA